MNWHTGEYCTRYIPSIIKKTSGAKFARDKFVNKLYDEIEDDLGKVVGAGAKISIDGKDLSFSYILNALNNITHECNIEIENQISSQDS